MILLFTACAAADQQAPNRARVLVVETGAVYAGEGGQFSELRGLDSLGIRTVLDLDREHLVTALGPVSRDWGLARERGMRFVHLPLHPTNPPTLTELDWAVRILEDPSSRPIIVHADGDDGRAGMVIAAYRIRVQGWSPERALEGIMEASPPDARAQEWRQRLLEYVDALESAGASSRRSR